MTNDQFSRREFVKKAVSGAVIGGTTLAASTGTASAETRRYMSIEETNGVEAKYVLDVTSRGTPNFEPDLKGDGDTTFIGSGGDATGNISRETHTWSFTGQLRNFSLPDSAGSRVAINFWDGEHHNNDNTLQIGSGEWKQSDGTSYCYVDTTGNVSRSDGSLDSNDDLGDDYVVSHLRPEKEDQFDFEGTFNYIVMKPGSKLHFIHRDIEL